jgi:hypothetical protein
LAVSEGAAGGVSPLLFTLISRLSVAVPPGVVVLITSLVPVSSVQPIIPNVIPASTALANIVVIRFRIEFRLDKSELGGSLLHVKFAMRRQSLQ